MGARRVGLAAVLLSGLALGTSGPGTSGAAGPRLSGAWPYPNGELSNARVALDSGITLSNVATLKEVWSFALTGAAAKSLDHLGSLSSNPVVVGGVVYVQDMYSNVDALSLRDGHLLWRYRVDRALRSGPGPNGVAVAGGVVYAMSPTTVFALSATTGQVRWVDRHLLKKGQGTFGIQPQVSGGRVYLASQYGPAPGGGVLLALRARDGHRLWEFHTAPHASAGVTQLGLGTGGAWETPLVGTDGSVSFGIGNPYQTLASAIADPARELYTDSLVNIDAATGRLRWYYQAVPNDFKDFDLQTSPIATTVHGAPVIVASGKMGIVYLINARTGHLLWKTPVGRHNGHDNDSVRLLHHHAPPGLPFTILPGSFGGVLANLAVAGNTVYVVTNNLALQYTKTSQVTATAPAHPVAGGEIEALNLTTGHVEWDTTVHQLPLGAATVVNNLVMTTLFNGQLLALNRTTGKVVYRAHLPTSTNAPLAVAGDTVIIEAGHPETPSTRAGPQVIAYRLGGA